MKKPLQTRVVQALNRAGISDMHGDLYDTHGPNVVRFVLRKARADFERERRRLRAALVVARCRISSLVKQRANGRRSRFAGYAIGEIDKALSHE